jgi:hypothetical protein
MPDANASFFEAKVRPILADHCFRCHGPKKANNGLRLDSRAAILKGGDSGPALVAGAPDKSLLIKAIRYADKDLKMPPDRKKLPADAIANLERWVKDGAPWPESATAKSEPTVDPKKHWAFQAVKAVEPPADPVGWASHPIDRFLAARWKEQGLKPVAFSDPRTLLRRATFDLIGLPPAPEEIDAFLADLSSDAFAKVVDRLLASPHYGERWGRHWLDVARYADSNGMDENMAYGNAWRYRDYVIAVFNRDMPYDQFIREQVAGDLLADVDQESGVRNQESGVAPSALTPDSWLLTPAVATGFLSIGPKMLAEDDPVKMEMDIIDEQLDTIGRTFMGLTLGCARCHEHKYDPISMEDYYALAGIFKSTQTMDNFKVVARWHERPLGSKEAIERQRAHRQQVAEKKAEISRVTERANETLLSDARLRVAAYLLAAAEVERQAALAKPLKSIMVDPQAAAAPGVVIIEAENFARGNVKKEFAGYGEKIGVIYNQGELPNFAEYEVTVAVWPSEPRDPSPLAPLPAGERGAVLRRAPAYQIELRYAAAESRPVKLFINGRLVQAGAAGNVTGSWYPDTQAWAAEGIFTLRDGPNTIRLERAEPFPHLDKLALVPLESADGVIESPKTPEQLAAENGLNVDMLQQWVRYLAQTRSDPASVLHAWHALRAEPPASAASPLFVDLKLTAQRALAARYGEHFEQAERAWQELKSAKPDARELPDAGQESLRQVLYDPKGPFALPPKPEAYYSADTSNELNRLREQLAALEKSLVPLPEAMAVADGKPQNLRVHLRGSHLTLGEEVPRQFLRVIAGSGQTPIDNQRSGRLELAEWLTRPDHPLTARVMVNRIWRWHFGAGLVRTPDNFGKLGERPTHPALLDWLARRFVESGWSIKAMHRLIMLSATYQMSTAFNERAATLDPDNRLHWRMNRRRLEAEAIRDAILAISGQLDRNIGGSLFEGNNRAYVPGYPNSTYYKYDFLRRSVYLPVIRSDVYSVLQAFDFADPSTANGDRATTTVAPQALFMMNSKLVQDATRQTAAGLLARSDLDDTGRVRLTYERSFGRPPSEQETRQALAFVSRYNRPVNSASANGDNRVLRSWQALCRAILASNEFIFVE